MAVEEIVNDSGFNIGDFVAAKKFANFEHDFKGVVEKIYEHSLLVLVTENDPEDQATVNEYNHRAVVRMSETKVLIAAEVPEVAPAEEAEATDMDAE